MRVQITKGLILGAQSSVRADLTETLFPAGEYLANLTLEERIEILNSGKYRAQFTLFQFREKINLGEFVLLEN